MNCISKEKKIKKKLNNNKQWIVWLKICPELNYLSWFIPEKVGNEILKKTNGLLLFKKGIPSLSKECCFIKSQSDTIIICYSRIIILEKDYIFEIKEDLNGIIENEIFKTLPEETYKEVYHLL